MCKMPTVNRRARWGRGAAAGLGREGWRPGGRVSKEPEWSSLPFHFVLRFRLRHRDTKRGRVKRELGDARKVDGWSKGLEKMAGETGKDTDGGVTRDSKEKGPDGHDETTMDVSESMRVMRKLTA